MKKRDTPDVPGEPKHDGNTPDATPTSSQPSSPPPPQQGFTTSTENTPRKRIRTESVESLGGNSIASAGDNSESTGVPEMDGIEQSSTSSAPPPITVNEIELVFKPRDLDGDVSQIRYIKTTANATGEVNQ